MARSDDKRSGKRGGRVLGRDDMWSEHARFVYETKWIEGGTKFNEAFWENIDNIELDNIELKDICTNANLVSGFDEVHDTTAKVLDERVLTVEVSDELVRSVDRTIEIASDVDSRHTEPEKPPLAEAADPPRRAELIMHFALPKRDRECVIGDLEEEYRTVIRPKYGARGAAWWYWWQVVRSVMAVVGVRVRVWMSIAIVAKAIGWFAQRIGS